MGGELKINSSPGEGSTFYFSLPFGVPVDVPQEFAPRDRSALHGLKALVVDDNLVAQQIMTGMLQSLAWDCVTAESAEDALAMLRDGLARSPKPFDVIFLDWYMPGKDGLIMAEEMLQLCGNGERPLMIMVTANGRDLLNGQSEVHRDMLDGYLIKPVTSSMLYDAVAEASAVRTGAAPVQAVPKAGGLRRLNGMRLLVVEDNLINQQVADELLTREGAEVKLADNGQVAVDMLREHAKAFDLVLMDMQMPVMDGLQATHAIRNRLHQRELPIIAMTANAMASDREACLAAGMNDHVGKPFDLDHLVRTLLRWAGGAVREPSSEEVVLLENSKNEAENSIQISAGEQKSIEKSDLNAPWPAPDRVEVTAALHRLGGDPVFFQRIVRHFCTDLQPQVVRIAGLAQPFDTAALSGLAAALHTLKGTASTVGAFKLAAVAADAERSVKDQMAAAPGTAPPAADATPVWLEPLRTETMLSELALRQVLDAMQQRLQADAGAPSESMVVGGSDSQEADAPSADWRGRWLHPLQQLADLLAASDMQALELHDDMLQDPALAGHPQWQSLHAAMDMLDFEAALAAARELLQTEPT
jgi:CheY-like chemotaxis protein